MRTSNTKKMLSALAVPAVALSILAPSAWGQDALGACLGRKDDKERLACYDAATGRTSRTRVRDGDRREEDDERPRRTEDERFRRTEDGRPRRTDDERFRRTDDERPRRTDDERFRRTDDERPRPRRAEREGPPPDDGSGVVEILKANEGAGDLVLRCKDNKTEVAIKLRGFVYYPAEPNSSDIPDRPKRPDRSPVVGIRRRQGAVCALVGPVHQGAARSGQAVRARLRSGWHRALFAVRARQCRDLA